MSTLVAGALAVTPLYATAADAIVAWDDPGATWRSLGTIPVGGGTVTSVAAGAGITVSPSPIVGAGTVSLVVPVSVANGGTGATTGAAALTSLGAITNVAAGTGLTGGGTSGTVTLNLATPVAVASGGTGTTTVFTAGSVLFAGVGGVHAQDNANLFWDDANNRLGVGLINPVTRLDVVGGAVFNDLGANIRAVASAVTGSLVLGTVAKATASSGGQGTFYIYSNDAADVLQGSVGLITDATAGNRRLAIQCLETNVAFRNVTLCEAAGNVGIGTAAPASKLQVAQSSSYADVTNAALRLSDTTTPGKSLFAGYDITLGTNGKGFIQAINSGVVVTDLLLNPSGGNVGIGLTVPLALLHVNGQVRVATNSQLHLTGNASNGYVFDNGVGNLIARSVEHNWQNAGGTGTYALFNAVGTANQSGAWAAISAREMKQEIAPYTRGLEAITALQPCVFRYRAGTPFARDEDEPSELQIGLIADEVEPVMPEIVGEMTATVDKSEVAVATLMPGNLIYAVINSIKELAARVEQLEKPV